MRTAFCARCNAYHPLYYVVDGNGNRHLILKCPRGMKHKPMIAGLDIPTHYSKRWHRRQQAQKQGTLL